MKKDKFHFLGIGGSGMSAAANLAIENGYQISGCDKNSQTPYIESIREKGARIFDQNSASHISSDTTLVVSPAALFDNKNEEVLAAKEIITWQQFLSEYLTQGKTVICIAGTHGKSTTTALASCVFEDAGLDPSVMIGANVKRWNANYRNGKGQYFIIESDEFYDNFLSYSPDIIVLNNIEFDHPDYFKTEEQLFKSFKKHIGKLKGLKVLIYNSDDKNVVKLLETISDKDITIVPYKNPSTYIETTLIGKHNQYNAEAVIQLAKLCKIPKKTYLDTIKKFTGIGRRMDILFEGYVTVIDDYAHHPTAIKKTLQALRERYPDKTIHAIVEPHSYSRTKATLDLYKNAFSNVDTAYIMPIFKARDQEDFGISEKDIVTICNSENVMLFKEDKFYPQEGAIIIVMGAGNSYKVARQLVKKYENQI